MNKVLPLLFWSLFSLNLAGPQTDLTLIYRLTDAEAEEIYRQGRLELTDVHFHSFVDSFSTKAYHRTLVPGHYLYISAEWEQLVSALKDMTTLNPARAEQMYFPTLVGNNETGKIRIMEDE